MKFDCLAQPALEAARARGGAQALESPLGRLLKKAVYGDGETRGMVAEAVDETSVSLISWTVRSKPRPQANETR
jgi:hypothetical protein